MEQNTGKTNKFTIMKNELNKIRVVLAETMHSLNEVNKMYSETPVSTDITPTMSDSAKVKIFYTSMFSRMYSSWRGIYKVFPPDYPDNEQLIGEVRNLEIPVGIILRSLIFDTMIIAYCEIHRDSNRYMEIINFFCKDGFHYSKKYLENNNDMSIIVKTAELSKVNDGLSAFTYVGNSIGAKNIYDEIKVTDNDLKARVVNGYHLYQWYSKYDHFTIYDGLTNSPDAMDGKVSNMKAALEICALSLKPTCEHLDVAYPANSSSSI